MRIIGNRCHYMTKQIFPIIISVHSICNAADSPPSYTFPRIYQMRIASCELHAEEDLHKTRACVYTTTIVASKVMYERHF
jgi:hypothetical protein